MTIRRLIVNADDFGQSDGINRGIIEAHERGIVTSASLMVRWPAAAAAAAWALEHPACSVGLHLDLGEYRFHDGGWEPVYTVVETDDPRAVQEEIARQFDRFHDLMGKAPTHIDSHQHVHLREPARALILERARSLGVPLRSCSTRLQYCGQFYGQDADGIPLPDHIGTPALVSVIRGLPAGVTELGCHPGYDVGSTSMYGVEREREVAALCDPAVRAALVECAITLCSFADVGDIA